MFSARGASSLSAGRNAYQRNHVISSAGANHSSSKIRFQEARSVFRQQDPFSALHVFAHENVLLFKDCRSRYIVFTGRFLQ